MGVTIQNVNIGDTGEQAKNKINANAAALNTAVLPNGGTAGQVLQKIDDVDLNVAFQDFDLNPQDYYDNIPQGANPDYLEGREWYSDVVKGFLSYNDNPDTPPLIKGRTLRARVINNTGVAIAKGKVLKVVGLQGRTPIVQLAQADKIADVQTILGVSITEIPAAVGSESEIAVFDSLTGQDTSGASPNQLVYVSDTAPGGWTTVRPVAPNYAYSIGFVSVVDATFGVIAVKVSSFQGSDTIENFAGGLNGIASQTPNVAYSVSGGIIYADVTNEKYPTKNLPFIINGNRYLLNTTTNTGAGGAARVIIPPGADSTTKQGSIIYAYLNAGIPDIGVSTSEPAFPHAVIAKQSVFDAARTLTDGRPFAYRRFNDAVNFLDGSHDGSQGIIQQLLVVIRDKLGSNWISGQDGTPIVDNTQIRLTLSAGLGRQFRLASLPAFDGNNYLIYNTIANLVTYEATTNLAGITQTAAGESLLSNNRFYKIRIFYQLNSNGIGNSVIATRPLGYYTTAAEAVSDPLNYAVAVNDTDIEEIIYPLYDLVIGRTGTGGTVISLVALITRKSKLPGGQGGGGAAGSGGTDDKVRISVNDTTNSYLNDKLTVGDEFTKEIVNPAGNENLLVKFKGWIFNTARTFKAIFNVSALTADQTFTLPNFSGLIAVSGNVTAFLFGGQVRGGSKIVTFSATPTFNLNEGNSQQITLTANITSWTLSNALAGSSYGLYFKQDATGGWSIPDCSAGTKTKNSGDFTTAPNDENIVNVIVKPDGTIYWSVVDGIV